MKKKKLTAKMTTLLLLTSVSGLVSHALAEEQEPSTELERFEASVGDVLVKGFQEVGALSCLYGTKGSVSAVVLDNPTTGDRLKGLKIEAKGNGQYDSSKTSFVDFSEIDSLISGINYIETMKADSTPLASLEATYTTEGGLVITKFTRGEKLSDAITVGKYSSENCFLREGGMSLAKQTFIDAKVVLEGL